MSWVHQLAMRFFRPESAYEAIARRLGLSLEDVRRAEFTIRYLSGGAHPVDNEDLESMLSWRIAHGGKDWAIGN